ncbi:MAG: DUF4147 domain-containing protein [Planctomycetota bacterium]|nr:DUF4147 domain-containing protein [Planctomycetota bacterium]
MKTSHLAEQAIAIWRQGVAAVDARVLVRNAVRLQGQTLRIGGREYPLETWNRIAVVGAGKAGAGMAQGIEEALGPDLVRERVTGWINVPADCVRKLDRIVLHAARPAGLNEPTADGVAGSERILEMVSQLGPNDLCLVLLSGGGSALLPAPITGISLEAKQQVTRFLMQSGATIQELNTVRKRLSRIKGGALARAIRAGATETLIISDVVGDPLDIIASGPTADDSGTVDDALVVLRKFHAAPPAVPAEVFQILEQLADDSATAARIPATVHNQVIGNNRVALEACARAARELGFTVIDLGSENTGEASEVGRDLARRCRAIAKESATPSRPTCLLSGGEPIVRLAPAERRGVGGRNQQLALAALVELFGITRPDPQYDTDIVLLSGGTDGEDGPTDAAGAVASADVMCEVIRQQLNPQDALDRNDAYRLFEKSGGLLRTGPTHTNVMDVRVALVHPG